MDQPGRIPQLNLKFGDLCVDFVNTVDWHASTRPVSRLMTYDDLVTWGRQIGLVEEVEAQQLRVAAIADPLAAAATLQRATTLREALYRIFVAHIHHQPAAAADMDILNTMLLDCWSRLRLVQTPQHFTWAWREGLASERMLWSITRAAVNLLTSTSLDRLGQCADERGCGWLFLDLSKNRSRRWCDINDCGNYAKARRHYQRIRARSGHTSAL